MLKYAQYNCYNFWKKMQMLAFCTYTVDEYWCFHLSVFFFCPWALMKMLENSGFEKQLVTNSLSAFVLSLAVLSTLWRTCIHYLSAAPKKQQLHACVTTICYASTNILGGTVPYRELYISPKRSVYQVSLQTCCTCIVYYLLMPNTVETSYNSQKVNYIGQLVSGTMPSIYGCSSTIATVRGWRKGGWGRGSH